jgi:hypothetical protein
MFSPCSRGLPAGINVRPDAADVRLPGPMQGAIADDRRPDGPTGLPDGGIQRRCEARVPDRPELRRVRCMKLRSASSAEVRRPGAHRRLPAPRPRRTDRQSQATIVGVRRRARSGGAAALLLSSAQQTRNARSSRGSLLGRGRPRASHLGTNLRRRGPVFLDARASEEIGHVKKGGNFRCLPVRCRRTCLAVRTNR